MRITTQQSRELLDKYPAPEPYFPTSFCLRGDTHSAVPFRYDGRYVVFPYETYQDIRDLHEYLISYQARNRGMIDVHRQRLVHPFGEVDHFAVVYRHHPFFEWLGLTTRKTRHIWRIPDRLMVPWGPVIGVEGQDIREFMAALESRFDKEKSWFADRDFAADVEELGGTHVRVIGNRDFFLESYYGGTNQEWHTKWTLLKLRWS